MDDEGVSALQGRADDRLSGHLRAFVEHLRAEDLGWRPVAARVSEETGLTIGYETLRGWAERGGWNVDKPDREVAS